MVSVTPVESMETSGASPSSNHISSLGRPTSVTKPNETSPLLQQQSAQGAEQGLSGRWHFAQLSVSAFIDSNTGLLFVAASSFCFSAMIVSVKWLNTLDKPVPTLELIWVRMVMTYIFSVLYMYFRKIPHPFLGPKGVRVLLVLRGFAGFVSIFGLYFSLLYLSLSDATVLTFVAPILTVFAGAIFLKETLSLKDTCAGLCSFFGVLLIARPHFLFGSPKGEPFGAVTPWERMLSVCAALVGVLGITGSYIILRAIGNRAHTLHSLSSLSSQCVLISTIAMMVLKISPVISTRALWLVMLLLISIFGLTGQIFLTMGLQRETASRGSLASYISIVFAAMFEFVVFHTTPSALSIAGTAVIMSSAIYTSLVKNTAIKPATGATVDRRAVAAPDGRYNPEP
ncbi:hypothetical protein BGW80DRAFT_1444588 [Lactifluus volemus]|nr:hypothetical protein BGW80DRAFT_1444588 [Lactifluus volemus]